MLTNKRKARKHCETNRPAPPLLLKQVQLRLAQEPSSASGIQKTLAESNDGAENVAIFPFAIPMLAGPAAIMSVMVLSVDFNGRMLMNLTGYGALLAEMVVTGNIMALATIAGRMIDPRLSNIFSKVAAIILLALSVQFLINGLTSLQLITAS